jgi:soluble lytic murein transglycosylase
LVNPELPNEAHWLVAHVLRRMERFQDLRQITELAGDDWKTRYPTGPDFERWCLAYPQAYEDKVAKAAKENAIPKELVWAIMREESSFDPNVESWANAMGLMQLILPTARALGRQLGIRVNRRTLRRPDVNITLGTAYLGYLKERMDAHPALIIAGYNAGEGAVARWWEDAGGTPLDLFVEQIPYNQTRGYTKRVISTYAVYRFLYSDTPKILRLDLKIP